MNDTKPGDDGVVTVDVYFGGAVPTKPAMPAKVVAVDDEIVGWLQRREQRRERLLGARKDLLQTRACTP